MNEIVSFVLTINKVTDRTLYKVRFNIDNLIFLLKSVDYYKRFCSIDIDVKIMLMMCKFYRKLFIVGAEFSRDIYETLDCNLTHEAIY